MTERTHYVLKGSAEPPFDGRVFWIKDGKRKWVPNKEWIEIHGLDWPGDVQYVSAEELDSYPEDAPCAEPWNIAFEKRLLSIHLAREAKKRNIVYIYEKADTSTFRYRAYNMCQALSLSTGWHGTFFFENELPLLEDHLSKIDVFVLIRMRWSLELDIFINSARRFRIPILFDIDDLVYSIKSLPLILNTLNIDYNHPNVYEYWFAYVSRLYLTGTLCDGTIGTNEFLSQKLRDDFDKPSYIVNNFLNQEQINVSNIIVRGKNNVRKSGRFVLGYFSGTPSHINDFKKVSLEVRELLDTYPDMMLRVVGFMDFPECLNDCKRRGQVVHEELVDFLTLQKKVAEADVNIVPLVENEFTNCKSELKFFEAAIVETITCATPTYVYKKNIVSGINGYLCNDGEWFSRIEEIYQNKHNKDLIANARAYCLAQYSPEVQSKNLVNVLDSIVQ